MSDQNSTRQWFHPSELEEKVETNLSKATKLENLSLHFDETHDEVMKHIHNKISNIEDLYQVCGLSETFDVFTTTILDKVSDAFNTHKKALNMTIDMHNELYKK